MADTCEQLRSARHLQDRFTAVFMAWSRIISTPNARALLADWTRKTGLIQVRTNGLGIFTGEKPIIYLRLAATDRLEYYHRQIWQHIQATPTLGPSPYYAPHTWLSHITLGIKDVIDSKLDCAISQLAFQPYDWSIRVDNLTIASYEPEQSGEINKQFRLRIENGN